MKHLQIEDQVVLHIPTEGIVQLH